MAKRFIGGGDADVAPAGSVQAFAGAEAPYGWLLCQGQELNIEDYPKLYEAIGSTWNTQVNPTSGSAYSAPAAGKFRLPDFRGSFLRGAGSPHVGDTCTLGGHQSDKTAKNGLGLSWSSINVTTNSNTHSHTVPRATAQAGDVLASNVKTLNTSSGSVTTGGNTHSHTFNKNQMNTNQSWAGDSETRPLNQGVNYIIKY